MDLQPTEKRQVSRDKVVQLTIVFGSQTITMRKEFEETKEAKWWFDSFICSLKNLFHFLVIERK